ncbi:hypothetical protein TCE0_034r11978 [Talaromyces pinophilus]|uniref:ASST-domain-containing protein n=1 Tax=Talaromyces pinophilus TaxID=128442 RepID=A0A6V8HMH9_TALPI|nr:hypothetical protein TCE0_034r11978 [Talaromyces pinophilus]
MSLLLACINADVETYYQSEKFENGNIGPWPTQHFKSSDIRAPILNFVRYGQACRDGLHTFIAPRGSDVYTPGPMILDQNGHLVWFKPMGQTYNMNVQTYKGQNYLTFWSGDDSIVGHGEGTYYMLNKTYQTQYQFAGANGLRGDLHEFHITLDDTAVYTVYDKVSADLTSVGGPQQGWLWDGTFQELDIETGELLFQWRASEHYGFEEAYRTREGHGNSYDDPWDFFHINSIDKDNKGNFLISSRYYHSLTYIDGRTGEIIWKLGGKDNRFDDLSDGAATNISWQHHARFREGGKSITIFDNSSRGQGAPIHTSRGLWIDVNQVNMTARARQQFWNPTPISSQSQGSVQLLENGNVLVGYGYNSAWTEFNQKGEPLCEVHMGPEKWFGQGQIESYRVYKHRWVGKPTSIPVWLVPDTKQSIGYVSWNGATEVKTWMVEGSYAKDPEHTAGAFGFVTATPKAGFETAIFIPDNNTYPQLRVVGLNEKGRRLGASQFVLVDPDFDPNLYVASSRNQLPGFVFFIIGFLTCAIFMFCGWAHRLLNFQGQKWESLNPENGRWWNKLRFGPLRRSKKDIDDVEDTLSERDELLVAHADDFELPKMEDDKVGEEIHLPNTTEANHF